MSAAKILKGADEVARFLKSFEALAELKDLLEDLGRAGQMVDEAKRLADGWKAEAIAQQAAAEKAKAEVGNAQREAAALIDAANDEAKKIVQQAEGRAAQTMDDLKARVTAAMNDVDAKVDEALERRAQIEAAVQNLEAEAAEKQKAIDSLNASLAKLRAKLEV